MASLATSLSAKAAVTCIDDRPTKVTKPDDDDPVPDGDVDALEVADTSPPPDTDCPTMPLTDATVPPSGARSVVSDSVRCAVVRFVSACTIELWSCAIVLAVGGACFTFTPSAEEVACSFAFVTPCVAD